jgi:hypothetical protein
VSSHKSGASWQSDTIGGGKSGGTQAKRPQRQDPDKPWAIEMRESFEVTHSVNPTSTDELHRKFDDEDSARRGEPTGRNNSMRRNDGINQVSDDDASTTHETQTRFPY